MVCGNYGAGNIGDEAILRALIQKFEKEYSITVISARPEETVRAYGLKAVGRLPGGVLSLLRATLTPRGRQQREQTRKAIAKCDVFLLGGGTLITDTPLSSILIWSKQLAPAIEMNKEIWIYASGIGPVNGSFAQEIAKKMLKSASKVTVRDVRSLEWTRRLGMHDAHKVMDPVFKLRWAKGKPSREVAENTVIIVPRFWRKNIVNIENSFSKFVQYLCLKEGKKVIGIPFEKGSKKDIGLLNKIFDHARVGDRATIWKDYHDDIDVIRAISCADAVIGMRLHSLIFAEITETPFVGVSYMEKVAGLGESLKKTNQIVDLEELSFEKLKAAYKASLKTLE